MSESVYVGLCLEIGTTQQVATRRDITDMQELLNHIVKGLIQIIYVKIGIHRKEFRFKGSDKDMLFRQINHRVLCMGLLSDYNVQHTQIYTDSQRQVR